MDSTDTSPPPPPAEVNAGNMKGVNSFVITESSVDGVETSFSVQQGGTLEMPHLNAADPSPPQVSVQTSGWWCTVL